MIEIKEERLVYNFFKYLWIMILLPKTVQFAVLVVGILIYCRKIRISKNIIPIFAYAVFHIISILINMLVGDYSTDRILAAFNTALIWIVACIFFSVAYETTEHIYISKIAKYCIFNIIILCIIYLFANISDVKSINILSETRLLWSTDWTDTGSALRFGGLFEYGTLCCMFVILSLPLAVTYLLDKRKYFIAVIFAVGSLYLVYETRGRTGLIVSILLVAFFMWLYVTELPISDTGKAALKCIIIVTLVFLFLLEFQNIVTYINSLLNSRTNSNNTRTTIYITSVTTAFENSPIWGMGIKVLSGKYPLGSHCTYIGVFYKTGFVGSLIWLVGMIALFRNLWKAAKFCNDVKAWFLFSSIALFMMTLATEDLDGADWLTVMFFSLFAIYLREFEFQASHNNSAIGGNIE